MQNRTVIVLLVSLGLLTACGAQSSTDSESSQPGDTTSDASNEASQLPDWYRAEFPRYADAEPTQVRYNSEHTPDVVQFAYSVGKADGDKVAARLRKLFSENGWAIEEEYKAHRFRAEKAGGYSAIVGVTVTKWVTIITVTGRR